jgi:thioredoxin 1
MAGKVTDGEFKKEVLESNIPVLVDFWAEWCGPCKMLAPTLDELSKDLAGKVKIVKMNVDENPAMPSALGIRGIPTMMLFKNGENVGTKVGASPKAALAEWINSLV